MADKRIPASEIRRVWLDETLTVQEAATQVGLVRSALWKRATQLNLPPRHEGRRVKIKDGDPDFMQMWIAGVMGAEIAAHFNCHPVVVSLTAKRMGLPKRTLGRRPCLSMDQYQQTALSSRMAQQARLERQEMVAAGLVDGRADRLEGRVA